MTIRISPFAALMAFLVSWAPATAATIEATASIQTVSRNGQVVGSTSMPDGTVLLVSLVPHHYCTGQPGCPGVDPEKVTVDGGVFATPPRCSIFADDYDVLISMMAPAYQPKSVQALIGKRGENLRGVQTETNGMTVLEAEPNTDAALHITLTTTMLPAHQCSF